MADQHFGGPVKRSRDGAIGLTAAQRKYGGEKEHADHRARYRQMKHLPDGFTDELATDEA
jgi:hypothetical protein